MNKGSSKNFYAGHRPPIVKPIDICGRGLYETGRPPSEASPSGPNFNTPALPTVAFENIARVSFQPSWLISIHAVFNIDWTVPEQYVLLYDLNPGDAAQLSLINNGANARYTLGPPSDPGGTIIYEANGEVVPVADNITELWAFGIPFNFGIIAVASSTPRTLTLPDIDTGVVSITARIQT